MKIYNKLIKTKFALQTIETVTAFLTTKSSIYITFLGSLILLTPYIHIIYAASDEPGLFGFVYMTSFLFALALPVSLIASGLLIKFISTKSNNEYTKAFSLLSNLILFSGSYFLIYTLYPMTKDFNGMYYYAMALSLAVGLSMFSYYFHIIAIYTEQTLRNIIKDCFKLITYSRNNFVDPSRLKDHDKRMFNLLKKAAKWSKP